MLKETQQGLDTALYIDTRKEVYLSDALPNPGAVMICPLYTVVADGTMRRAWRSIDHARITITDCNRQASNTYLFSTRELVPDPPTFTINRRTI